MSDRNASQNAVFANGAAYENYVGRWSRMVAAQFLQWLAVPPAQHWLDVGCGTGALSEGILQKYSPASVKGVDSSAGFVAYAQEHIGDPRVIFQVGNAQDLPIDTASVDVAVSGLMLNFAPQPQRVVEQLARVVKLGGIVSLYVWDYSGTMQLMTYFWAAAASLDPQVASLDEGLQFSICNPSSLIGLFQAANLQNLETRGIEIETRFEDFDDYWRPFLEGQGSAPTYVSSLSEAKRAALREKLRAQLPFAPDGSIPLAARAWGIRGIKQL